MSTAMTSAPAIFANCRLRCPTPPIPKIAIFCHPNAYEQLAPLGRTVGSVFLALSGALAAAGVGWFKRRVWGWGLAVVIIATQVAGDWVNIFMGELVRGGVGVVIAGALLFYILRPRVREAFRRGAGLSTL